MYNIQMRISLALIALCGYVCSAAVVVENVTVVDVAAGTVRPHQTAVIEGERIVAVGPQGSLRLPLNARMVDGTGRYLSPGLWDMRVQLRNPDRQLPAFLAFGVTGIRDPGGNYMQAAETRLDIQKGRAIGPRIVASGPGSGWKADGPNRSSGIRSVVRGFRGLHSGSCRISRARRIWRWRNKPGTGGCGSTARFPQTSRRSKP